MSIQGMMRTQLGYSAAGVPSHCTLDHTDLGKFSSVMGPAGGSHTGGTLDLGLGLGLGLGLSLSLGSWPMAQGWHRDTGEIAG